MKRKRISAGLLMYRITKELEFFLVHPGGPYFQRKDANHWTIPKGEVESGEELFDVALREFNEETGLTPRPPYLELGWIQQKGGKIVHAWAFEAPPEIAKLDEVPVTSNLCPMEWPPGSGKLVRFPEVDRGAFFPMRTALIKLKETQHPFLEDLEKILEKKSQGS
jgi:predicted NUDIX family NTP pyrophosphohydrolase